MKSKFEEFKHKEITRDEFLNEFGSLDEKANLEKLKAALQTALDIRKFEIGLYWQRATYFWAFIAAAFVAFGALVTKANTDAPHYGLQEMMAVLGLILSIAWWYVNKGSRFWQKNWEAQVDLLEDYVQGAIYKTIYFDLKEADDFLGAKSYSVTKINLMVVFVVGCVWLLLLLNAAAHLAPPVHHCLHSIAKGGCLYTIMAVVGVIAPAAFFVWVRIAGKSENQIERRTNRSVLLRRLP